MTLTGATLHGDVYSSFDGNTEYWWRHGGTTAYGSETPHRTIAIHDESAHPVSEPLTRLAPNTTYHFQLCARDGEESPPRTNCSTDQKFSTASAIGASRIAFIRYSGNDSDVFAMSPTGAGATALTTDSSSYEDQPGWSPDAGRVAFHSDQGANWDIRAVDADGTDPVRLTTDPALDWQPDWSPDGTKIAFTTSLGNSTSDIFVMDSDGSDLTRLTSFTGYDRFPTWSPDGRKIAFGSRRGGNDESHDEIWVMDADGSDEVQLTSNSLIDVEPDWSRVPAAPSAR